MFTWIAYREINTFFREIYLWTIIGWMKTRLPGRGEGKRKPLRSTHTHTHREPRTSSPWNVQRWSEGHRFHCIPPEQEAKHSKMSHPLLILLRQWWKCGEESICRLMRVRGEAAALVCFCVVLVLFLFSMFCFQRSGQIRKSMSVKKHRAGAWTHLATHSRGSWIARISNPQKAFSEGPHFQVDLLSSQLPFSSEETRK